MANYFALPGLTAWSQIGGWSDTSGGVSNGVAQPGSGNVAVFDANSGAARTINMVNGTQIGGTNFAGSAAMAITITSGFCQIFGNLNLAGAAAWPAFRVESLGAIAITAGACPINGAVMFSGGVIATLIGDAVIGGRITLFDSATDGSQFNVSGNVTTAGVDVYSLSTCTFGAGIWSMTSNAPFSSSGGSYSMASATIKYVYAGTGAVPSSIVTIPAVMWNACGPSAWLAIPGFSLQTFKASPGTTTKIPVGSTLSATTWDINGSGTITFFTSETAGSSASVAKLGGGTAQFNYASIKDISCATAGIFSATNSKNVSGNTNINFIVNPNNFGSFF